ncbi:MAG: substrate-binding domain-containing protein [Oscillospiraceae bacterium]|nr:substrate-binding domain-containing protein [Oscillospiraceae bacterium]
MNTLKRFWTAAAAAVTVTAILLFAALWTGRSMRSNEGTAAEPIRILCFKRADDNEADTSDVWQQIYRGLRDAIGGDTNYTISVYTYDDYLTLTDRIACALLIKPDVVLLPAGDGGSYAARFSELDALGIGYILFDGKDWPGTNRLGFITSDNWAAGYTALEVLAGCTDDPLQIGLIGTGFPSRSLRDRENSFREAAAKRKGSVIVEEVHPVNAGSLLETIEGVRALLTRSPQINALFCSDSIAGQAAAEVLREFGRTDAVHLVCFDTNEYILHAIEDGTIDATLMQRTYDMGRLCLQVLEDPAGPKEHLIDCVVITKNNLGLAR